MKSKKVGITFLNVCLLMSMLIQNVNVLANEGVNEQDISNLTRAGEVTIDKTNFPDENFRKVVTDSYDTNKDGKLDNTELARNFIAVNSKGITNLKGIEFFTEIILLNVNDNQVTELDTSNNKKLQTLMCRNNKITSINISSSTLLESIDCSNNQISNLNVANNTNLISIDCSINKLTSLDVSSNLALSTLVVNKNELTALNVDNNTKLKKVDIGLTKIKEFDASKNASLEVFTCLNTPELEKLNLSQNRELKDITLTYTNVPELRLSNYPKLTYVIITNSQLQELDVSNNPELQTLNVATNKITKLNVDNNVKLLTITCFNNLITELDLSNNTKLINLYAQNNKLTSLDVSNNNDLEELKCSGNLLTKLDLTGKSKLKTLWVFGNKLDQLIVKGCTSLTDIQTQQNSALTYDFTECTSLTTLACWGNKLLSLKIPDKTLTKLVVVQQFIGIRCTKDGTIDLKSYVKDIDASKISNVTNAKIEGTVLSGFKSGEVVKYDYDCGNSQKITPEITIYKALNKWDTQLKLEDYYYGDKPNEPVAKATYGNVKYQYSESETGTYTDSKPTDVGVYYVIAYVDEMDFVEALKSNPVSFKIKKTIINDVNTPIVKGEYGDKLSSITLPKGWEWVDSNLVVEKNNKEFKVRYQVDDKNNDYTNIDGYDAIKHYIERTVTIRVEQLYKVTFDFQGGKYNDNDKAYMEVMIQDGELINLYPQDNLMIKDKYIFNGWFIDKECTTKFDIKKDIVTSDMTLYAGWKEKPEEDKPITPGTGDDSHRTLYIGLMVLSLSIIIIDKKRKNTSKNLK